MPPRRLRFRDSREMKLISGPMLLAAHWSKHGVGAVRIRVAIDPKELSARPVFSASKRHL
jgi:hypothetical protein